ncbi:bifunctional phosphoribosyl-AMP cyclohydrolase/phosphoribosyl-ATP diphosphatase HisIE [Marinoscillum sp. MHG1-6]|uniref:bifunctional phosphoribosyl-AMP cyclohydrolase/phosphoribosyl-ATP diphosphatase HisIE n=1 Tax=Marinoscillum sp. MHG1-6 TaxID=2959627 RepID=UPI00215810A5|nr:bifunctional phosphoribosyl-AMP cyclohydrolase/phosphoribosyl-ATP diphosphatase HisIE [Marinoscillum sp. MHG1-6]
MELDFAKGDGLIPAIIQDELTGKVLMLGYMNEESLAETEKSGKVTFFSRSKNRLWTKGETSGNFLHVKEIIPDCDKDTLLIKANPVGPACHTGADTCFNETNSDPLKFLNYLTQVIEDRKNSTPDKSYTSSLFAKGVNKVAQKVGEEAVEVVIEAMDNNNDLLKTESADLIFHLMVLLAHQGLSLADVVKILEDRHKK